MRKETISRTPARRLALAVAVLAFANASTSVAGTKPDTSRACAAAGQLQAMLCLVNETRAAHGLARVRLSSSLLRSAQLRANAIVRCRQFSHTPCGQSFGIVFRLSGYARGRFAVGENLAWGAGASGSPQHTLQQWLASPGHRRVLLSRGWREIGVSIMGADGLFAPGVNTVWVAQFGRRG